MQVNLHGLIQSVVLSGRLDDRAGLKGAGMSLQFCPVIVLTTMLEVLDGQIFAVLRGE